MMLRLTYTNPIQKGTGEQTSLFCMEKCEEEKHKELKEKCIQDVQLKKEH